ncbi:MAG: hypothetical protein ABI823_14950 [Bryobacteraceae bacterium]
MVTFDSANSECIREVVSETITQADSVAGDSIQDAMAKDFGSVPEVKFVLAEAVPSALLVWIAVDSPDTAVRYRIYDKELGLVSEFPDIDFDFNLVSVMDRSSADIATGARLIYSRS